MLTLRSFFCFSQEEELCCRAGGPADPAEHPDKFENLQDAIEAEKILRERYARVVPASTFPSVRSLLDYDIVQQINQEGVQKIRNELLSISLDEVLEGAGETKEVPDLLDAGVPGSPPHGQELPVNGTAREACVSGFDETLSGVPADMHRLPHSHAASSPVAPEAAASSSQAPLYRSAVAEGALGTLEPHVNHAPNSTLDAAVSGSASVAYSDIRSTVTERSAYTGTSSLDGQTGAGASGVYTLGASWGDGSVAQSQVGVDSREEERERFGDTEKRVEFVEDEVDAVGVYSGSRTQADGQSDGQSPHASWRLHPPSVSPGVRDPGSACSGYGVERIAAHPENDFARTSQFASPHSHGGGMHQEQRQPGQEFYGAADAGAQFLRDEFVDVAEPSELRKGVAGGSDSSFSDVEA
ncbi:putative COPI protein [Toxoplasma gondii p89]|uniref:Putative COPI protein n=1 Tax=Toxoplasma gondii p89 TaxID=943119 RepID=A0A086JZ14_TOXGO|nr:putative COPI protein [Toxoplasma gondii p89]